MNKQRHYLQVTKCEKFVPKAPMDFELCRTPVSEEYELGDELGTGTYSFVRVAVHRETNKKYAAKFIYREDVDVEVVKNEIRVFTALNHHEGFVHLYKVYEANDFFVLVLDLMEGGDLRERLTTLKRIPEDTAIFFLTAVADAICFMHSKNVIHRDIKPENMLTDPCGTQFKLSDFGTALILDNSKSLDEIEEIGSPEYMAPEIKSGSLKFPFAVDVFSFGVCLYVLVTGELLPQSFHKNFDNSVLFQRSSGISAEFKNLICNMLLQDPSQRSTSQQVFFQFYYQ